jgi:L-lactate dehydrogenase (cytochrome)
VAHAIHLLRAEVDRNMAMLGINSLREMNADLLWRDGPGGY